MTGFWGEKPPKGRFPIGSYGYMVDPTGSGTAIGEIEDLKLTSGQEQNQQARANQYWKQFDARVAAARRGNKPTNGSKVFPVVNFKNTSENE